MQSETEAISIKSMHKQQGSAVKATGKTLKQWQPRVIAHCTDCKHEQMHVADSTM